MVCRPWCTTETQRVARVSWRWPEKFSVKRKQERAAGEMHTPTSRTIRIMAQNDRALAKGWMHCLEWLTDTDFDAPDSAQPAIADGELSNCR